MEHELAFDRRGQLTSRTRGGWGMSWEYDADGNRTGFTDVHGTTTTYVRNAAGRVTAVSNPRLGEAVFTHDASGRITSATAGDLVQEWSYRFGSLSEHSRADRTGSGEADVTLIGRDGDGRITALTRAGAVTRYGYDGAGQMVSAATTRNGAPEFPAPLLGVGSTTPAGVWSANPPRPAPGTMSTTPRGSSSPSRTRTGPGRSMSMTGWVAVPG